MGKREWEHGTLKLPSAEFSRFRKAMQDQDAEHKKKAFELTQEFWKGLTRKQRTDPGEYKKAQQQWSSARYQEIERTTPQYTSWSRPTDREGAAKSDRLAAVSSATDQLTRIGWGEAGPRRVLATDMDYPTNRTTEFGASSEATVTFNKADNTVTWDVPEGSRAARDAHESPMGRAFFEHLDAVKWSRGTGGSFTGNDEYNQDADYEGGGANYTSEAFGPLGAQHAPNSVRPWTDPSGRRFAAAGPMKPNRYTGQYERQVVEVDDFGHPKVRLAQKTRKPSAASGSTSGPQGRVGRGVSAGGQFANKHHAESPVRLG